MLRELKHPLLLFTMLFMVACGSGNEDDKTIASTHPKLEKQLDEDSLTTPVHYNDSSDLYHRYRITLDEYETDHAYAVQSVYSGHMPDLDISSLPEAGSYRTSIQDGLRDGINFAGKYTVVSVGCGTSCQQHFIVNRETGKITEKIQSSIGAKFRQNSRIFIINPPDSTINYSECANCSPEAYVLENNKLRKLSEITN